MAVATRSDDEVDPSEDQRPGLAGRTVSMSRAAVATAALMFLTGAAVYAWQSGEDQPDPNPVDIGFADDMFTHHLQGVAMAVTYLGEGTDPILRQTANEIIIVQAGEARLLGEEMEAWGRPDSDPEVAMDWMGMPVPQDQQPGMATEEQLAELETATGAELDDLFTTLMIEHHRGGIHMAEFVAANGSEPQVLRLAEAMVTTQQSEIGEMNARREAIGLPAR